MNPVQKSPERAFALQKYLLLHSQHDALQKRLDKITTSLPTTASQSPDSSLSSSPESRTSYLSFPPAPQPPHRALRPMLHKRRSSLPAVIDESLLQVIREDEKKLKNVNSQIKCTLTDLLNCESVKEDRRYRLWVQTRLMDTEKALKNSRSRSCGRRIGDDEEGGMMFQRRE